LVVLALAVSTGAWAQSAASVISPESALELMQHGDCTGAWKQFEKLRRTSPDDRYVTELTGAFLLDRGDAAGALAVYRDAISRTPAESLVSYGLAIAEIGCGDLAGAERALKTCEQNDGDAESIREARRYIKYLRGDYSTRPELKPSVDDSALDGMAAMRSGRHREATELLQKAIASGSGDPFLQSEGPLMSFDGGKAIAPAVEIGNTTVDAGAMER
jgi:Flp pilus assembly protein TadD